MKKTLITSMALVGMLFVVTPVIGLSDVQAKTCMHDSITSNVARSVSLKTAKRRARSKWSSKVKKYYGYHNSSWQLASNRNYTKTKISGIWRVLAHGIPCQH